MHAVELDNVSRFFGDVKAVDGVSVQIAQGEFFSMLGPSGSGKTTCLRLVAGFEQPDAGRVLLAGADATRTPPFRRDVNTVFQDYALFPHMNVRDNVGYGLRMKGVARAARDAKAAELLALVGLDAHGDRRPSQLSGGQRQRVALARALINEPKVLLLDEPLGALDLKLREQMQTELKGLQKRLGITFIYVTHDQGEALAMSDRVAVFSHGKIEQLDAPQVLYERPKTAFVATFVGGSNVVAGALAQALTGGAAGGTFSLRKESITLDKVGADGVPARIADVSFHGNSTRYTLEVAGQRLVADDKPGRGAPGDEVKLVFPRDALVPVTPDPHGGA